MACEREDCAFISVSLVRRKAVPLRMRLPPTSVTVLPPLAGYSRHDFVGISDVHFSETAPYNVAILVLPNLNFPPPARGVIQS
jgi:hypothetical protein